MSRRKRKILIASVTMAGAFLAAVWLLWFEGDRRSYIPGSNVEGLNARLDREIPEQYEPISFSDVTALAGISFTHFNAARTSQLPEDMGSGVAWFDYNNDGWDDLFILNFHPPLDGNKDGAASRSNRCALYRNEGDGTFTDVSEKSGLALSLRGMSVAAADYDNDGWTDLFLTAYGENLLMRNRGDGTFEDRTSESGLGGITGYWAGASWGDYNRDGHPDLYVTGYVKYVDFKLPIGQLEAEEPPSINPSSFRPERNLFYHNNGDGTFKEVAESAGVQNASGRSLSATWVDVNEDRWPDLYVANDVSDNILYLNRRDGRFEDLSHSALVADYRGAMGLAAGDWDNDRDIDLFITHWIAQENALFTNLWYNSKGGISSQRLQFRDESNTHGLGQSSLDFVGWATTFTDLDLDGRLDLYVTNGSTFQFPDDPTRLQPMTDQVYWNAGPDEGFYDVSSLAGPYFTEEHVGRGGAVSDYDRDGDPDLFIVNHNGQGVLLRNDSDHGNHWLAVRVSAKSGNSSALGTHLYLRAGDRIQVRQVGSQSSYLSQNSLVELFGLGQLNRVDTLRIHWPSGVLETYTNIPTNRLLFLVEGSAPSIPDHQSSNP